MIADADQLAKKGKPHYIEEQGAQYEGLTVWFNSMVDSAGGGRSSPPPTRSSSGTPAEIGGLDHARAGDLAGRRSVAQRLAGGPVGHVAFENGHTPRSDQLPVRLVGRPRPPDPKVFKEMGYAPFPEVIPGLAPHVSIGGYNLGVSAYSQHPAPGLRTRSSA